VSASLSEVVPMAAARSRREIWAVGGGKGGIGKSFITASLGWELAGMGRRVVLVDADLGGANLHLQLGMPKPARTLGDFIQRRASSLEEVLTDTPVPGLRLVARRQPRVRRAHRGDRLDSFELVRERVDACGAQSI